MVTACVTSLPGRYFAARSTGMKTTARTSHNAIRSLAMHTFAQHMPSIWMVMRISISSPPLTRAKGNSYGSRTPMGRGTFNQHLIDSVRFSHLFITTADLDKDNDLDIIAVQDETVRGGGSAPTYTKTKMGFLRRVKESLDYRASIGPSLS